MYTYLKPIRGLSSIRSTSFLESVSMPTLNNRRGLIPDSVCVLLDDAHEFLRSCAEFETALQCVGHPLQRALSVPEREQS